MVPPKKVSRQKSAEDLKQTMPVSPKPAAAKLAKSAKAAKADRSAAGAPKGNPWLGPKLLATVLAFALRFWRLGNPDSVVFDEVHFGKFASHYLQREYYFDLHPPLAKLMFAGVGWLVGYDGRFKFDNIGDSYVANKVPYVAYRALSALLGSATVPLAFGVLEHCGISPWACFFGAALIVFDNAQITQTRLILLDAALSFFVVASLYCYVKFRNARHTPFSLRWWAWLLATGVALSCVISTKYVGLFTFMTVGVAVAADLWNLLDIRGKAAADQVSVRVVAKHFVARVWALLVVPFCLFLLWFWVHFAVLSNSGPGDSFMSPEFQATLGANPVAKEALDVYWFDTVRLQSQSTQAFLHSHLARYPMQYADGRISSQGQQVTGYPTEDVNNLWQILPAAARGEDLEGMQPMPILGSNQIMLRHVATDSFLMTHDVASPGYNTNEEFTTTPRDQAYGDHQDYTLFNLDLVSGGDVARTKLSLFRLRHVKTSVSMWLSDKLLPDWGFGQLEINGNKRFDAPGTLWTFSAIAGLEVSVDGQVDAAEKQAARAQRRTIADGDVAPRRSFWTDYCELQSTMFRSNNELKATHPYMSAPQTWPLLSQGISFWSHTESRSQIYLVGNFFGWYVEVAAVLLFAGLYVADWLAVLRDEQWITHYARQKLHGTLLWLFLGWAFHYAPFFLMGRQLFLHHYLPAQIIGALLTAGLLDFVAGQSNSHEQRYASTVTTKAAVAVLVAAEVAMFVYFAPLVYGLPLSVEGAQNRQWNNIQLHFNK